MFFWVDVERCFLINKECLAENLLNDSLFAHRFVYGSVLSPDGLAAVATHTEGLKYMLSAMFLKDVTKRTHVHYG
jgi:hypothetical protein